MNICFFSREYPPDTHIGGIGTYTYNMASALSKLGHTVHVITSTQHSGRTYEDNGVWVHRIRSRRIIPKELWNLNYSYLIAKKVSRITCRFDIVQSSEFASEAFWFALKKKSPLVTRLATPYYLAEELDGKAFLGPRRPRTLLNWMEKKQTLYSDGIFASTRALAKAVNKKWGIQPSRLDIIPNSIDISRVIRLAETGPLPDILKHKEFLLYFGRLEERKGVRVLARALLPVFERFPHIHVVFVGADLGYGGSSMKIYIKRTLTKYLGQLLLFDNLPQEKLFPIVNSAKMVILPSLWEAFGFVCVEAMALGRPIIATSGSGFEEIIENNISGYLIQPGNSELLADKIISTLNDQDSLYRISEAAKNRAQDFEVSKVALKLLAYYEKIRQEWLTKQGS